MEAWLTIITSVVIVIFNAMALVVSGAKPRASRLNGLSAATDEVWEVRNDR